MSFAWEGSTPEGRLTSKERFLNNRMSVDALAEQFTDDAQKMLASGDGMKVREEVGRFADKIVAANEVDLDDYAERLFSAFRARKISAPDTVDSKKEQAGFALALAHAHLSSRQ